MIKQTALVLSLAMLFMAGCGGSGKKAATTKPFETVPTKQSPVAVARCLNARGFLVQAAKGKVSGSSPGGVNFSVSFFPNEAAARVAQVKHHYLTEIIAATTDVAIDDAGNPPAHPGGKPLTLPAVDLHTIVVCVLHG